MVRANINKLIKTNKLAVHFFRTVKLNKIVMKQISMA